MAGEIFRGWARGAACFAVLEGPDGGVVLEALALVVVVVAVVVGVGVEVEALVVVDLAVVDPVVVACDVADDVGFVGFAGAWAWWVGCFGGAPALGSDSTYCDTAAGGPWSAAAVAGNPTATNMQTAVASSAFTQPR